MIANFFFIVSLLAILFILRVWWIWKHIEAWVIYEAGSVFFEKSTNETPTREQLDAFEKEVRLKHYNLAWSGEDPLKVIGLCVYINQGLQFQKQKSLTSDYYGQIKHLIKKGRIPTAIVFWLKAKRHSDFALRIMNSQDVVEPIDFEVLSAPYFMLTKIPLFGKIWNKYVCRCLVNALTTIDKNEKKRRTEWRLANAMISAKLYALTGNNRYMHRVPYAGLKKDDDPNQLLRIAKHLKLPDTQALFRFCKIA